MTTVTDPLAALLHEEEIACAWNGEYGDAAIRTCVPSDHLGHAKAIAAGVTLAAPAEGLGSDTCQAVSDWGSVCPSASGHPGAHDWRSAAPAEGLTYPAPGFPKRTASSEEDWLPIDGKWHHVTRVRHAHGVHDDLYVDGSLVPVSGQTGPGAWDSPISQAQVERIYADTVRSMKPTYYSTDDPAFAAPVEGPQERDEATREAFWADHRCAPVEGLREALFDLVSLIPPDRFGLMRRATRDFIDAHTAPKAADRE